MDKARRAFKVWIRRLGCILCFEVRRLGFAWRESMVEEFGSCFVSMLK